MYAFCMDCFSEELTNRITEYFKRRFDIAITPDQAEDYLNSMADLYMAFAEIVQERSEGKGFSKPEGLETPSPLSTYTTCHEQK